MYAVVGQVSCSDLPSLGSMHALTLELCLLAMQTSGLLMRQALLVLAGGDRLRALAGGPPSAEGCRASRAVPRAGAGDRAGAGEVQARLHLGAPQGQHPPSPCTAGHVPSTPQAEPQCVIEAAHADYTLRLLLKVCNAWRIVPLSGELLLRADGAAVLLRSCRWMQRVRGLGRGQSRRCRPCWGSPSGQARRAPSRWRTRSSCRPPCLA